MKRRRRPERRRRTKTTTPAAMQPWPSTSRQPKPYRLLARLKNNRLWWAIQQRYPKVQTQTDAARALAMWPSEIGRLLNMSHWPWSQRDRDWTGTAKHISQRLGLPAEWLFAGELYGREPGAVNAEVDAPALQAAGLLELPPAPDAIVEQHELRDEVKRSLHLLTAREADVLRRRFGLEPYSDEQTLEAVGQEMAVTRERVKQIEAKALRKLRHPSRGRILREYIQ